MATDKQRVAEAYAEVRADLSQLPKDLGKVPGILKQSINTNTIRAVREVLGGNISGGLAQLVMNRYQQQADALHKIADGAEDASKRLRELASIKEQQAGNKNLSDGSRANLAAQAQTLQEQAARQKARADEYRERAQGTETAGKNMSGKVQLAASIGVGAIKMIAAASLAYFATTVAAAQRASANLRTEQLVRATGEAAGWSAEQLKKMAEAMRRTTQFGTGDITKAQQSLLKNPNIKGDQFEKALNAAADLAAVMGTDLPQAAAELGDLLADPIKAAEGGLEKYGILLTAAEQGQIRNAMAARDFAKAQEIVLSHLSGFAGAAGEAAYTGVGGFEKLKNSVFAVAERVGLTAGNIGEAAAKLGEFIEKAADLQIVQDLVSAVTYPFRALFDFISEFIENNKADFEVWGQYVSDIYHNFRDGFIAVWEFLQDTIGEVLGAIGDLFGVTWQDIKDVVTGVLDEISLLTTNFGLTCEYVWLKIQLGAQNLWDGIRDGLAYVAVAFEATWDAITAGAEALWDNLEALFTGEEVKGIAEATQDAFMKGIDDGMKKYNFGDSPAAIKLRQEISDVRGEMEKKRDEKRDKRAAEEKRKEDKRAAEADPGTPSKGTPYVNTKPFKFEFVGFTEMSKKIQQAIYPDAAMDLQKAGVAAAEKAVQNGNKANGMLAEIRDKIAAPGMKP